MKLKATYSAVKLAVGATAARVAASVSAIRLAVGTSPVALQVRASSKRLSVTASAIRLLATTSAIRVAVELGAFLQKLGLQDSAVYADLVAWALNRAASDAVSAGSVSTKAFERGVDNMAAFSDGDQPYFAEAYVLNESGWQDYALDSMVPKDVGKVLSDGLLVTFSILATVDVSLDRVIQDPVSAVDTYSTSVSRTVADGYNAIDSAVRTVEKPFADATSSVGVAAVRLDRSITDTISVADVVDAGLSGANEYTSASAVSDAARASVEKLINDAVAATASAVTGILTTEESATPTYAADSAVKSSGINRSDSAITADSGSVRSQGYVDFTYMAEDYVGSYETF